MHYKKYKTILSPQNGMNLYRGCTHGCIYCDSRSKCYQMQHDFEDIEVKTGAPELLEAELRRKRGPCMIATGSMTDSYMPLEAELGYTRRCLEIIERYGFGLAIQTKSDLILRDLDLLRRINEKAKCVVQMTLTTYDEDLCRIVEPNVCTTKRRAEVLNILRDNGIPTVAWLCPFLPWINDTEENIRGILGYCIEAKVWGIVFWGTGLTLRDGDREYFYDALDCHFPGLKERYQREFGYRYQIYGGNNDRLSKLVAEECGKHGIICDTREVFEYMHEFPASAEQLSFF